VWSSLSPLKKVTWKGERYDARELSSWLSQTVYNGTLSAWVQYSLLIGFIPVGLSGVAGVWFLKRREETSHHIRGAELLTQPQLQARLRARGGAAGVTIAGITIPRELHRTHFLVCGATGSGKTATIRRLLRQIVPAHDPCIIVDPEGEFTQEFYTPTRSDVILNPLDGRFPGWDPWAECETEADREAQAASLFPTTPGMHEASVYYHSCARIVYAALLARAPSHDPHMIPTILTRPDQLLAVLEGTEAAALLGARATNKRDSILSTLQLACNGFKALPPTVSKTPWAARKWVTERQGWCFLTFREEDKEQCLPLISLWLESLSRRLLSGALHPEQTTWVVIDELAVLKVQPTLQQLLTRGRKRGVAVVLGFQDVLQLEALYGKPITANMLDQPSTRVLLRTNNGDTQRWCAEDIGRLEVERAMESETVGPENVRDAVSRSTQRKEEYAVMGSQFSSLPNLSGYLKVAHYGTTRITLPYVECEERQPAFVGRTQPSKEKVRQQIQGRMKL